MISLRELKTLVAIADYGTFAKAGQAIGLTQSAISLQVKSLESEFDIELFDRTRRPPAMNAKGSMLVKKAREVLMLCQQLKEAVQDDTLEGILRIGVVPTVMTGVLPETLAMMQQTHPELMIKVKSGLSAELVAEVANGEIHAAIVTEPSQLGRGLSWHAFVDEPLVLIAPEDAKGEVDSELLASYPFIQFQPETWAGQLIESVLADRGFRINSLMSLDSLESIGKMVANGLGVSVVPCRQIENPFPAGLKIIPFGQQTYKRVVGVVERTSNPKADFVKALYDILVKLSADVLSCSQAKVE